MERVDAAKGTNECAMSVAGLLLRPGSVRGGEWQRGGCYARARPPHRRSQWQHWLADGQGRLRCPLVAELTEHSRAKAALTKHRILTGPSELGTSKVGSARGPLKVVGFVGCDLEQPRSARLERRKVLLWWMPPTNDGQGVKASWLRTSEEYRDRHSAIPT
jgi:hypothetical protein